MGKIQAI